MPVNAEVVYKDRDTIIAELVAAWQTAVPDVEITVDSVIRIWIEVAGTVLESLMLANQLLHDDIFPQTASALALQRFGDLYGRDIKGGTLATGTLRFAGAGGTVIPQGTLATAPSTQDDPLRFATTADATIPNPGVPSAPAAADAGAGGLAAGTYEFAVTFQTAAGETALGATSNALVIAASHNITLTNIPLGGSGTIARNLYVRVNGGFWNKHTGAPATALADNTTTTVTVSTVASGSTPPDTSTAEQVDVAAESEDVGSDYNVDIGTITVVTESVAGVTGVVNLVAFANGTDPEDIEAFRSAVIEYVRNPQSGSPDDLKSWAESVDGVDTATVFQNDNLGVTALGHSTIRITGPDATIPSAAVQQEVLDLLNAQDIANMTLHISTFTPKTINVTVTLTLESGYGLADVTSSVQEAISDYVNGVAVGGTVYVAGLVDAVFGLPGVATVVVNSPAADTTSAATEKPTIGTVSVN